jgi:hypothetical protein
MHDLSFGIDEPADQRRTGNPIGLGAGNGDPLQLLLSFLLTGDGPTPICEVVEALEGGGDDEWDRAAIVRPAPRSKVRSFHSCHTSVVASTKQAIGNPLGIIRILGGLTKRTRCARESLFLF